MKKIFPFRHPLLAGCVALMLAGRLAGVAHGETLVDTNFAGAAAPIPEVSKNSARISGTLPAGWKDDSDFNEKIDLTYEKSDENGTGFLRVRRGGAGYVQLRTLPMAPPHPEGLYRLTVTARTPDSAPVEFMLRKMDGSQPPFRTKARLYAEWTTQTYEFSIGEQKTPVALQINIPAGPATLDIKALRLERFTKAEIEQTLRKQFPGGDQARDLIFPSRFPLGLPQGWVIPPDFDKSHLAVASDPAVPGPGGGPSLRLDFRRAIVPTGGGEPRNGTVISAPFAIPWSFAPHTLSLFVRGSGMGVIRVLGPGNPRDPKTCLATREFKAGESFRRIVIPFDPAPMAACHAFSIEAAPGSTIWIDAPQLDFGRAARPQKAPASPELALAIPPSDASESGIQFVDEPARVAWQLTGFAPGARLQPVVTGLDGKETALPPVALQKTTTGTLDLAAAVGTRFGLFRVEVRLLDPNGKPLCPTSEFVLARLPRPKFWGKDAPESHFGIHVNPTSREITMAKAVGRNWVRLHDTGSSIVHWFHVEPRQGEFQFNDEAMARYRDRNLLVFAMLATAPGWANGTPGTSYWEHGWVPPTDTEAWKTYVRKTVAHHRESVAAWDIWNEPWLGIFMAGWENGKRVPLNDSAARYVELSRVAFESIREADPKALVVGVNTTGEHSGDAWTQSVISLGALQWCDVISYHLYNQAPFDLKPEAFPNGGLTAAMAALPPDERKPIWLTEGGSQLDSSRDGIFKNILPYPNADDWQRTAAAEVRFQIAALASGTDKVFCYRMSLVGTFSGNTVANYAEIIGNGMTLHPSGVAAAAMAWMLDGLDFQKSKTTQAGCAAHFFAKDDQAAVCLTPPTGGRVPGFEKLPAGCDARDLFGNPCSSENLPEAPVYLLGPSEKLVTIFESL